MSKSNKDLLGTGTAGKAGTAVSGRQRQIDKAVDNIVKGPPPGRGRKHPSAPGGRAYRPKAKPSSMTPRKKAPNNEYGAPMRKSLVKY